MVLNNLCAGWSTRLSVVTTLSEASMREVLGIVCVCVQTRWARCSGNHIHGILRQSPGFQEPMNTLTVHLVSHIHIYTNVFWKKRA